MILTWHDIYTMALDPATWWQLGFAGGAFVLGSVLALAVGLLVRSKFKAETTNTPLLRFVLVSIFNASVFASLLIVIGVSENVAGANSVLLFIVQCAFVSIITSYLWIITGNWKIPSALLLVTILIKLAKHLSIFHTASSFLDKYSLSIGAVTITPLSLIKILLSILFLVWISTNLVKFLQHQIGRLSHLEAPSRELMKKGIGIVVYAGAVLFGLHLAGIQLTTLAVLGGGLTVGIGLGLQKIAANFVSGLIILVEGNLEKGDLVEIEGGPGGATTGTIKKFGSRSTRIEASDGREILVPNEDFVTSRVVNWTLTHTRAQILVNVDVVYSVDVDNVRSVLIEAAETHPECLKTPAATCVLTAFSERGIRFQLQFHIADVRVGRQLIQSEVMTTIVEKFRKNDIEFAQGPVTNKPV